MTVIFQPSSQAEWEAYYELRYLVLRAPWNQPRGSEKDEIEASCIHLFATRDNEPAGVCRLQYNSSTEAQVRFMGVDEKFRGHKIGKLLLDEAERIAKLSGRQYITLQARENAVKFYESCGYAIIEKTFLMWGLIQHYRMEKQLV